MTATAEITFTEHSAVAEGFTVRYWEAGEGTPLVYLHPAGGPKYSRTETVTTVDDHPEHSGVDHPAAALGGNRHARRL